MDDGTLDDPLAGMTTHAPADDALSQNERALVEEMGHISWTTGPDGQFIDASAWCAYTGQSLEDVLGGAAITALHPDDQERIRADWRAAAAAQRPYEIEYRLRRADGIYRPFLARSAPVRDPDGTLRAWAGFAVDMGVHKEAEAALRLSEEKFSTAFSVSPQAITISSMRDGRYIAVNEAFCQFSGFSAEEAIGHTGTELGLWVDPEERQRGLVALREHGQWRNQETSFRLRDGTIVSALISAAVMMIAGEPHVLTVAVDITAQKAAEEALRLANARMDEFLHLVSHELRAPLTTIRGMVDLSIRRLGAVLADEYVAANPDLATRLVACESILTTASRQVDLMNRLINDLLDVSRLDAGYLDVQLKAGDLVQLVSQGVEAQRHSWSARTIRFQPPDRAILVMADPDRLNQVLSNLIGNACTYTEATLPIDVQVEIVGREARVSVRDYGPGLSAEQQAEIWERYKRGQMATAPEAQYRSGGGLGLGLYISRGIIVQHGGRIGVDSTPGQGATFWFTLPLATGNENAPSPDQPSADT